VEELERLTLPSLFVPARTFPAGVQPKSLVIAAFHGITLAEYVSARLRPIVTRDFDSMHKECRAAGRGEADGDA
jgi:hypothetical protein